MRSPIDSCGNLRKNPLNRGGNLRVFCVDDSRDLRSRLGIQFASSRIRLLSSELAEVELASLAGHMGQCFSAPSIASTIASWNCGRTSLMALLEQSGHVRLVSRLAESWRTGSIHSE